MRLNPPGTVSYPGSFDGPRLLYQHYDDITSDSDIWVYDTATKARRRLSSGVNTTDWEWGPSKSGDWLLFGRGIDHSVSSPSRKAVILRNLATGEERVLAQVRALGAYLFPGGVNSDSAIWNVCGGRECEAFDYNIAAKKARRLPNGGAPRQFATITPGGRLYAVRADRDCGKNVRLVRIETGSPAVAIMRFPAGTEPTEVVAFEDGSAGTRVYFERLTCKSERSDIFRVLDEG